MNTFTPAATLDGLWPDDAVAAFRPGDDAVRWLSPKRTWRERASMSAFEYAGSIPSIVHEAGVTPAGLELLRACGIQPPDELLPYRTTEEMRSLVEEQVRDGHRIGIGYTGRRSLAPSDAYVTPPDVIAELNDKAHLAEFLPAEAVPDRDVMEIEELRKRSGQLRSRVPLVLKASTRLGHGGGVDVRVCRSADDLEPAIDYLSDAERIVVEDYHDFHVTWCMSFGASDDGVTYFGAAQQVCDAAGRYYGNWCLPGGPGERAIEFARHAARAGQARGYRGVLGIDVGLTTDGGRPFVFDLNFRTNGSTSLVLFHESIRARWEVAYTRVCAGLAFRGTFDRMLSELHSLFERRRVLPYQTFDTARLEPTVEEDEEELLPACSLFVVAEDVEAVNATVRQLRDLGFESPWLRPDADPIVNGP